MGTCVTKNSKQKNKSLIIEKKESFYEIFQVNENFKNFIDIPKPQENPLSPFKAIKDSGISSNSESSSDISIILSNDQSSLSDLNHRESDLSDKKIPDASQITSDTTKIDLLGQKKGLHSVIMKSIEEVTNLDKGGLKSPDAQPRSPNNPYHANFATQSLLAELFMNHKKIEQEKRLRNRPKRLTHYNSRGNYAVNLGTNHLNKNQFLGFPSDLNDSEDEDFTFYPLTPLPDIKKPIQKNNESGFIKSIVSTDLENLDLTTNDGQVHIFRVPFIKRLTEKTDYKQKTMKISEFEYFYKAAEIGENPALNEYFNSFPNKWKNAEIPYMIEKSLMFIINSKNESLYNVIIRAIDEFHNKTVLRFVCYDHALHPDYLHFDLGKDNKATIGRHSGKNCVTLNAKADLIVVLHEIMHSLGFMHEHKRLSGDSFVYLYKSQLKSNNFIEENTQICLAGLEFGPFDYMSVMHYHSCEHMISYRVIKDTHETGLSILDCSKINFYYESFSIEAKDFKVKWNKMKKMAEKSNEEFQKRFNIKK